MRKKLGHEWQLMSIEELLTPVSREEDVEPTQEYRLLGVRLDGQGPYLRETKQGAGVKAKTLFRVQEGDFIYSRLFAWRGAFGVIGPDLHGGHVSGEFPTFTRKTEEIDLHFLSLWFRLPSTLAAVERDCTGSTPLTRNRFKVPFFMRMRVPVLCLAEQKEVTALHTEIENAHIASEQLAAELDTLSQAFIAETFARSAAQDSNWPAHGVDAKLP